MKLHSIQAVEETNHRFLADYRAQIERISLHRYLRRFRASCAPVGVLPRQLPDAKPLASVLHHDSGITSA